jgi:hypothetical protein
MITNLYHYIDGCGEVAIVYDHKPKIGEVMEAAHVVKPAGVKDGDVMYCLSCGQNCDVRQLRLKNGEL